MPQFFHRRWSTLSQFVFFGVPIYLLAAVGLVAQVAHSPYMTRVGIPVDQPVPFSHQHHVGRLEIDCRYCHQSVEDSTFSGMPSTRVCMGCHSQVWTGHQSVEPVRASLETEIPLVWRRTHDLPDFTFFDHSIHVHKGIGCVTCHGRIDQMPVTRQTETLSMQWCLECHREPERFVRPREHVFDMDWRPPENRQELEELGEELGLDPPPTNRAELGAALVQQYGIGRRTSCSNCHQ